MERIIFEEYQGKRILIEDFSNLKPGKEFMDAIDAAQYWITRQPKNSVLAILDATNAYYDLEVINRLKTFVQANGPYIKSSAVVGVSGLLQIALSTLSNVSGRKFPTFNSREEAMAYLVKQ